MSLVFPMVKDDRIVINTNVGEKAITLHRDGISNNMLGVMRPNSTWFLLDSGDNVFTYECEEGIENLQVTFTTPVLYGGV